MNYLLTSADIAALPSAGAEMIAYPGTPFSITNTAKDSDNPGTWGTRIVSIFRDGKLLGGYQRMYPSYAAETFAPFCWEGQWYAWYSANYTTTRVLRLNDDSIEDWCGEDASASGFCPTDYFLPQAFKMGAGEKECVQLDDRTTYPSHAEFLKEADECGNGIIYPGFGFLSGCHWGDDSSWKLRYVDYSGIADKVLAIDERFGYFELASMPLAECIQLNSWEPDFPIIHAHRRDTFCIRTPDDFRKD